MPLSKGKFLMKKYLLKLQRMSRIQQFIFFLIGLSILWVLGSSTYSIIHQHLIKTITIERETKDIVYSDFGFISPHESLLKTDVSGRVSNEVKPMERVAKNHAVFTVAYQTDDGKKNKSKPYYAPTSGIVSYQIDGYENKNKIKDIQRLDLRHIYEETMSEKNKHQKNKNVDEGVAYAKLIDNLKPVSLYMPYNKKQNKIFKEIGDDCKVRFPELNESTVGTVKEIIDGKDGSAFCRIELGPVSDAFLMNRVVQTEIYKVEKATLDLPKDVLVYQNGDAGVYIVENRLVQWKKVKIVHESIESVSCEILPKGTIVVLTPHRVSQGDIVKKG